MPTPPRMLTLDGETRPITEWSRLKGIPVETIRSRLDILQWDATRALTTPADRRFRRGGRPRADAPRHVPKLREHKPTGRAFVRWRAAGKDHIRYLGAWGSEEAKTAYRRFSSEWTAGVCELTAATN